MFNIPAGDIPSIFGAILSAIFLNENIFEYKNMVALVLVCLGIWMVNKEKIIVK